jgi:hypothetical protein
MTLNPLSIVFTFKLPLFLFYIVLKAKGRFAGRMKEDKIAKEMAVIFWGKKVTYFS